MAEAATDIESRTLTIEADAEHLERMRKEGHSRGFTIYCDELDRDTGVQTALNPLGYFATSIGF